jgi:hypothetical protein
MPITKSTFVRIAAVAAVALASISLDAQCGVAFTIGTIYCACGEANQGLLCSGRGGHACQTILQACGDGSCNAVVSSSCPPSAAVKRSHGFDVAKLERSGEDLAKASPDQKSKSPAPSRCGASEAELNDWLSHPRSEGSR